MPGESKADFSAILSPLWPIGVIDRQLYRMNDRFSQKNRSAPLKKFCKGETHETKLSEARVQNRVAARMGCGRF